MSNLVSACCGAKIIYYDLCSDCKEHCDVVCLDCDTDYPNGTTVCTKCDNMTLQDVRELVGVADKE